MRSLTRQLLAAILSINLVAFLYIRLSKVQSSRNEAAQSPLGGTFEPANATLGVSNTLDRSRLPLDAADAWALSLPLCWPFLEPTPGAAAVSSTPQT